MKRPLAAWSLLALAACVSKEPLLIPDHGEHRSLIAVVVGEDQMITATAAELAEKIDLPVILSDEVDLYLLYFRSELESFGFLPGSLQVATDPCARELPEPSQIFTSDENKRWKESELPARVRDLRFTFSSGQCPTIARLDVDFRCGNATCYTFLRQDGCDMIFELGACNRPNVTLPIDHFGTLCVPPSEQIGSCQPAAANNGARQSFSCSGGLLGNCELDFYEPAPEPQIEVKTVRLHDRPLEPHSGFPRPPHGWLGDLVILEDRVAVTAYGSFLPMSTFCENADPGNVHFLELESMTEIPPAAPAPSCLGHIARDPLGDGFIGAYDSNPPKVGRFTKDGGMIASVSLTRVNGLKLFPNSIAADAESGIAVVAAGNENPDDRTSGLFAVDLATMTELAWSATTSPNIREITTYAPGVFSALEDIDNHFVFIEARTGRKTELGALGLINAGVGQFFLADGGRFYVLSMHSAAGGVFTFELDGELKGRARPYSVNAQSWAIAPWPRDPRLVIAGITGRDEERAGYLAFVDLERPRFLPGAKRVGTGHAAVGRFRKDAVSRLWAVLPWTAEVIRLDPARSSP